MYIKRLVLVNIRCFKEIEIDFLSGKNVQKWSVFFGDNSTGKTTFLRSLAMGLCDATSSAGLLRELYGDWVRDGEKKGTILVEFKVRGYKEKDPYILTTIEETPSGYSEVSQSTYPDPFPWENIFVCGYGAARRTFGTKEYSEYSPIDAVYTLFNYDSPLQSPELVLRRLSDAGINIKKILRWIEHILMLPKNAVKLLEAGIEIKDAGNKFIPLGAAGDGYQATFGWVADLLSWAMMFKKVMFKRNLAGIVILDEIEQHLHPIWQRRIIKQLYEKFPKVQFISTTHAALCAIGTTDLNDKECQLILFRQEDDYVEALDDIKPPRGLRADQVLTSYLFGLPTTSDDTTREEIERYSRLLSKKSVTATERKNISSLRRKLDKKLGTEETELEREVASAIKKQLRKRPSLRRIKKPVIHYAIRKKIQSLLGKI